MHIEQADPADTRAARECHEVYLAAQRVDEPGGPWFTGRAFGGWLAIGWDGNPREVWLVTEGDSVTGFYRLELPSRENLDHANLDLAVHPAARRRGLGLALLRHAAGRAAENGRTLLNGLARDGSPGAAFAHAAGAKPGLVDVQRVLDVGALEKGKLIRLRGPAERAAAAYSLVSWAGPLPAEFTEPMAVLYNAMSDAPHEPGFEPEAWDAARIRESEGRRPRYGMHDYAVAARHDDTGELAGLTEVSVDPEDPGWGYQLLTVVIREHRGHRLGLLLKVAMMELLATTEPRLERIVTSNAASNAHMVAVNDALGYVPDGPPFVWSHLEVAAALALEGTAARGAVPAGPAAG
ncbi:MAG TPA: GNAT family N-acetyltransferase [Streptosporangiaceae bacterium]|nr:GNAT family N-acetyltransferase [Streptosporangiaceae bacterium]